MSILQLLSRTKLYWGLIAIFLIGVASSPVTSSGKNIFLSSGNLLDVLRQVSTTGLIATGMTAVIITGGIDVGAKREIYDLVFRLAREGLAILVVSSELPELLLLADRILVMSEGRQTGLLDRSQASEERIMQLAAPRRSRAKAVA